MKTIGIMALSSLTGGWANPDGCKEVQERVPELEKDPNADWEQWIDNFNRDCLGI